jgi:hypothetical protein
MPLMASAESGVAAGGAVVGPAAGVLAGVDATVGVLAGDVLAAPPPHATRARAIDICFRIRALSHARSPRPPDLLHGGPAQLQEDTELGIDEDVRDRKRSGEAVPAKKAGQVRAVHVAGNCVHVAGGTLHRS